MNQILLNSSIDITNFASNFSNYHIIQNNTIYNHSQDGIYVFKASDNLINNNNISSSAYGIFIDYTISTNNVF